MQKIAKMVLWVTFCTSVCDVLLMNPVLIIFIIPVTFAMSLLLLL